MTISQLKTKRPEVKEDDDSILQRFKERVQTWDDWYAENIRRYQEDTKFAYKEDGQWLDAEIKEYTDENKPRSSFNMIPRMLNVINGEYSDFDPDIMVRAIDSSEVPQEAIDLRTNLLRHIAFRSRNDIVYQTATNCALSGGFGAFRSVVENESPLSFNKVVRLDEIYDPTRCFWDSAARDLDKGDGNFCGITQTWKKETLKAKYPELTEDMQSISTPSNVEEIWETKDDITVADYYEKVFFKRNLALLSNGMVVDAEDAETTINKLNQLPNESGLKVEIQQTESRDDFYIMFYRMIHNKILERTVWDGKKLPIVFQPGFIKWFDGKEHTYSFVRWLKDTQRAYNYARSEFLYRLKLTRYEPFIAPAKSIEGYRKNWKNVYLAKGVLPYKELPSGARPERVAASEIPQSLTLEIERAYNDFQRITGRFDANLGAPSNEQSGIAILNRQRPGNKSVQVFFDNSLRAIESGANIIMDLIKSVIDTNRNLSVTLPNGEQNTVEVNQVGQGSNPGEPFAGNDLRSGEFLVELKASASFEIQREAQIEQIIRMIQAMPQLGQIMPDKLVELSGIKDAPALVKRVQENLIPQIALQETNDPELKKQLGQQLAQQQQMQQTVQQLTLMKQQGEIQNDRIEAMSKQITAMAQMFEAQTQRQKASADSALEAAKINAEEDRTIMQENREARKEIMQAGGMNL